jgi:hypothetical protein
MPLLSMTDPVVQTIAEAGETVTDAAFAGYPSTSPRDGTMVLDTTHLKLWIRCDGLWRWAALN